MRVVFLGTPEVVVPVVEKIFHCSEICDLRGVVTQPPTRRGRGSRAKDAPSPVHLWAEQKGIAVWTPQRVAEESFLRDLQQVRPDVCVTAAYGQYLPRAFLSIPRYGTVNIHPSLLPQYRGASPVQRALQDGLTQTGVSVLFSVARMDAGPVLSQSVAEISPDDNAETLLQRLFNQGANDLLEVLRKLQQGGESALEPREQNDEQATEAPKISVEEGFCRPQELSAVEIHNRVRAFSVWPGVKICLKINDEPQLLRLWKTEVLAEKISEVRLEKKALLLPCARGSGAALGVLEAQLPGKRRMELAQIRNSWSKAQIGLCHDSECCKLLPNQTGG